jgi:hypothetical protein
MTKGNSMSVYGIVTSELIRMPERRTSKGGKDFVTSLMKVVNGPVTEWWKICAFGSSVQEDLLQLRTGDVLSAQGNFQIETYVAENGETKLSQTVFAASIYPMRKPKADKPAKPAARDPAPFNDQIGF